VGIKLNRTQSREFQKSDYEKFRQLILNDEETVACLRPYTGKALEYLPIGLFGLQEYPHYVPGYREVSTNRNYPAHEIPRDEEYFEWMDILDSIKVSNGSFQFVEVGAGYGRWAARAYRMANLFGLREIHICTIEADPIHSNWLKEHMTLNHIEKSRWSHYECAVSNYEGSGEFFVLRPNAYSHISEAKNWYGQALVRNGWEGATSVQVEVKELSTILNSLPFETIDLLDFDIQGEEPLVLEEISKQLHRVKRIHIGTNSREDERFFRKFFSKRKWSRVRDYEGDGIRETYVGKVSFLDGVQTYVNPKFQ